MRGRRVIWTIWPLEPDDLDAPEPESAPDRAWRVEGSEQGSEELPCVWEAPQWRAVLDQLCRGVAGRTQRN